jgi:putative oxidoreductase
MGGLMIPHGYSKLVKFGSTRTFVDPFHIGTTASLSLTIFAEFFCASLIVLGLLTRLACIPLIIAMSVVVFYVGKGDIFGDGAHGALFLSGFIALLFAGPGKISLDRLIGK